jgi:hypothetical protein
MFGRPDAKSARRATFRRRFARVPAETVCKAKSKTGAFPDAMK